METRVHPSAFVDPAAELDLGVEIGAFAVVEAGARVGAGTSVGHHAVVHSGVSLGRRNRVYAHCAVGVSPQDLKYAGQATRLDIGDDNMLREFATFSRGTEEGGGLTRIGSHCLFMANTHVAHDCLVGDHVILANSVALAGHCQVGGHAVIGGLTGLHQHGRIGAFAMVGALSRLSKDVPPFSITSGCDEVKVYGLNHLGLKRHGFSREDITALEMAYRIFQDKLLNFGRALGQLEGLEPKAGPVGDLIAFLKSSDRGVYR
ncbi:MAG: acyl-ACP--UDP-N-acetylglucosamine O-acyltransferase, partial [bacterium]